MRDMVDIIKRARNFRDRLRPVLTQAQRLHRAAHQLYLAKMLNGEMMRNMEDAEFYLESVMDELRQFLRTRRPR